MSRPANWSFIHTPAAEQSPFHPQPKNHHEAADHRTHHHHDKSPAPALARLEGAQRALREEADPTRQTRGQARSTPHKPQLPRLQYRKHELDYATHHAYVDFGAQLLYCAIPKVACTEFFRLFHRMADSKKKCATVGQCASQQTERQRNRWKGDPHFRPDKPVLNKVATPEEATHAMNDRNFTKFVFFRDPAERLLSAYLDKFEHGSRYRVGYGLRIFKDPKMNFSGFVERIERVNKRRSNPDGLHPQTNPHWRPQRFMCNLEKFYLILSSDPSHLENILS